MKKRGFTLIELLVTLAIIALIMLVVVPGVGKLVVGSEQQIYNNNVKNFEDAARNYLYERPTLIPTEVGESIDITLSELITLGYMKEVKDPSSPSLTCDGVVSVYLNSNEETIYTPFLDCSVYKTSYVDTSIVSSISNTFNAGTYTITVNLNPNHNTYGVNVGTRKIAFYKPSIIDYTTWVLGTTGSQTGFSRNGADNENSIITKTNPWGKNDIVWAGLSNDVTSNDDGGWNTSQFTIDPTRTYRYTVWLKRENVGTGSGTTYFGSNGYNASGTNIGVLLLDGSTNTNFYSGSAGYTTWPKITTEWLLFVYYINPHTYGSTTSNPLTGVYDITGTKVYNNLRDGKWQALNARSLHRSYLYYSTKTDERQYWYRPRVDLVDGNEPTLTSLIAGTENPNIGDYTEKNATNTFTHQVTTPGIYHFSFNKKDGTIATISYEVK